MIRSALKILPVLVLTLAAAVAVTKSFRESRHVSLRIIGAVHISYFVMEGFGMPSRTVRGPWAGLSLLVLLSAGIAEAQPAFLVKDLNTALPQRPSFLDTGRNIAALGNVFLFAVDDAGAARVALWGSAA